MHNIKTMCERKNMWNLISLNVDYSGHLHKMAIAKQDKACIMYLILWGCKSVEPGLGSVNKINSELINVWMNYSNLSFVIDMKMLVLLNFKDELAWLISLVVCQQTKDSGLMTFPVLDVLGKIEESLGSFQWRFYAFSNSLMSLYCVQKRPSLPKENNDQSRTFIEHLL